jgi:hypothetical protein
MMMRLSVSSVRALLLVTVLHCLCCTAISAPFGDQEETEQHQPKQQLRAMQASCASPGESCFGNIRRCCRGPDACPMDGLCPGGGVSSNNNPMPSSSYGVYQFAVIGDTPYSDYEICGIPYELNKMSQNAQFLQHLGDLFDGQEGDCAAFRYTQVADLFRSSPLPVHFIFGDNEFTDCVEGEEWAYQQLVSSGLLTYGDSTFGPRVVRGSGFGYGDEYYYFVDDNILFVGLSLPGGADSNRQQDSVDWTRLTIEQNAGVRAVVLFGHSSPSGYLSGLRSIAQTYRSLHFLLLNDSHTFEVEYPFEGRFNIKLVRVDDSITPMYFYIDTSTQSTNSVFTFDRRCYCTTDHRPTKIVQWQGVCQNACSDVHSACATAETCSPGGQSLQGGLFTCNGQSGCVVDGNNSNNEPFCS